MLRTDPESGDPLHDELGSYWKYRVKRFRIVYAIESENKVVRVVAVAHRRTIYTEATDVVRRRGVEERAFRWLFLGRRCTRSTISWRRNALAYA